MPFNPPNFNLSCNVWHFATWTPNVPPVPLPDYNTVAQLRALKTAMILGVTTGSAFMRMAACFPALTDVRGRTAFGSTGTQPDLLELPAGSGRYYQVIAVDDVAKGFLNEYRLAVVQQVQAPVPLP